MDALLPAAEAENEEAAEEMRKYAAAVREDADTAFTRAVEAVSAAKKAAELADFARASLAAVQDKGASAKVEEPVAAVAVS